MFKIFPNPITYFLLIYLTDTIAGVKTFISQIIVTCSMLAACAFRETKIQGILTKVNHSMRYLPQNLLPNEAGVLPNHLVAWLIAPFPCLVSSSTSFES